MSLLRRLAVGGALLAAGCGFSPTAPFEGFDGKGTRVRGSFDNSAANSGVSAQSNEVRASAASPQGLRVSLQERPSIAVTVGADGTFVLEGLPAGSWTLVFVRDGQVVGEIRFQSVRRNQELTIVVSLTANGEVVLVQERRDVVASFEGECPRGAGFWCQNKDGKNPNLTAVQFTQFAEDAAALAGQATVLTDPAAIAAAVCNTGDQLLRQLATLSLNVAAGTLDLSGEVQTAFNAAVAVANDPNATRDQRNEAKDALEQINEGESEDCLADDPDAQPPLTGKITICHIPPGNPAAKHTLTIDGSAWPAHLAHGDTEGPC